MPEPRLELGPEAAAEDELAALRARWLQLIRHDLPEAARSRPDWPIRLDHCFARVILDAVCGRPWREVVRAPAYKHLSAGQLRAGLALGLAMQERPSLLGHLNRQSLHGRRQRRDC